MIGPQSMVKMSKLRFHLATVKAVSKSKLDAFGDLTQGSLRPHERFLMTLICFG